MSEPIIVTAERLAQIKKELRAAHAVIARAEVLIKQMEQFVPAEVHQEVVEALRKLQKKEAEKKTPTPSSAEAIGEQPKSTPPSEATVTTQEVLGPSGSVEAKQKHSCFVQGEFFDMGSSASGKDADAAETKDSKKKKGSATQKPLVHKRGTPTISRKEALKNFREIVKDREIIDLQDVNMIFGYNKSTSGTFIRCAIRRGDLSEIKYGKKVKYLAKDVKNFLKEWYDRAESED